jgi:hypothetical protein
MECKFILYFDLNMKENIQEFKKHKKSSNVIDSHRKNMNCTCLPGLEDILQAAYKFKK